MKKLFLCGFLFFTGICFYTYKEPAAAVTVFVFFCILAAAAVQDIEEKKIKDQYVIAIAALSGIAGITMPEISIFSRLLGAVCVSVPMLILAVFMAGSLGGGDIKLSAACGLFLGWRIMVISTGTAIFLGAGYGIYLLLVKKKGSKQQFAFGPFLAVGMMTGLLFWREITGFLGGGLGGL